MADPVVVHALRVFGVPHQPADVHAAIYLKFVAYYADYGDIFARPVAFFQHFKTISFAPFDRPNVHISGLYGRQTHQFSLFGLRRASHSGDAAVVLVQLLDLMLDVEILGNSHRVLVDPGV